MSGERAGEEVQAVGFTHEVVEQTVEAALNAIASSDSVGPMESRPKTAGAPISDSGRSHPLAHRAESKFCAPRVKMLRMALMTAFVL